MTNLQKWTSKDVNAIFDAANRYSVGLDDLFYRLHSYGAGSPNGAYPPYNIVKESNVKWRIELALAGWKKEDIEVTTESNILIVKSVAQEDTPDQEEYLHKGVAGRSFTRGFNLSDDVEIGEVAFNNGLLTIELKKVIPEHQKLKSYTIS
tara:strand:- start:3276 stop:3725 length:450 start_codon:yes stop_codon:yes gene_type:complete